MDLNAAYAALEIAPTATEEEAQTAYKDLIRVWHPDNFLAKPDLVGRATAKTRVLNQAWDLVRQDRAGRGAAPAPVRAGSGKPARRRADGRLALVFTLVLAMALGLALVGLMVTSDLLVPALGLEKQLAEKSFYLNRSLPHDIDADTRMTGTCVGPGKRFTFVYQLTSHTRDQVGPSYFEEVKKQLLAGVQANRTQDRTLKFLTDQEVVLGYSFKDRDGNDIATLELTPADYGTP